MIQAATLAIAKQAVIYLLGGLLLFGGYRMIKNHFIGIDNLHVQLSNESDRANRAEVSLGALEQTLELKQAHADELVRIRAESQAAIDAQRTAARQEMKVLEDRERFNRVVIGKPKLVENLANKATERVFDELETTFND